MFQYFVLPFIIQLNTQKALSSEVTELGFDFFFLGGVGGEKIVCLFGYWTRPFQTQQCWWFST